MAENGTRARGGRNEVQILPTGDGGGKKLLGKRGSGIDTAVCVCVCVMLCRTRSQGCPEFTKRASSEYLRVSHGCCLG